MAQRVTAVFASVLVMTVALAAWWWPREGWRPARSTAATAGLESPAPAVRVDQAQHAKPFFKDVASGAGVWFTYRNGEEAGTTPPTIFCTSIEVMAIW